MGCIQAQPKESGKETLNSTDEPAVVDACDNDGKPAEATVPAATSDNKDSDDKTSKIVAVAAVETNTKRNHTNETSNINSNDTNNEQTEEEEGDVYLIITNDEHDDVGEI